MSGLIPPKAAGTAHSVHPLRPLGVESSVGLLVLGLEHPDGLPLGALDEVAAAGALVDAHRVHALVDGVLRSPDQLREPGVVYNTKKI